MSALLQSKTPLYDVVSSTLDATVPDSAKEVLQPLVKWMPAVSPLSTNTTVATALAVYLGTIFGIQAIMKDQKPKREPPDIDPAACPLLKKRSVLFRT